MAPGASVKTNSRWRVPGTGTPRMGSSVGAASELEPQQGGAQVLDGRVRHELEVDGPYSGNGAYK